MAKVIDLPRGVHLSIRAFCEETARDRDTTARKIKEAGLKPTATRGGHPIYRLRDLLSAVYVTGEDGLVDPDRLKPFERKAHYQAEHEKLTLQTERGELVPRIAVEQEQARTTKIVVQFFDTLPDRLERDTGASPLVLAKVERCLDEVREELYRAVIDDEVEDDAERALL